MHGDDGGVEPPHIPTVDDHADTVAGPFDTAHRCVLEHFVEPARECVDVGGRPAGHVRHVGEPNTVSMPWWSRKVNRYRAG